MYRIQKICGFHLNEIGKFAADCENPLFFSYQGGKFCI